LIAADSSTWIAYFAGEAGRDVEVLDQALKNNQVVMVPAVLCELLSAPEITSDAEEQLNSIPAMPIEEGCWKRAGKSRAAVLNKGRRARLGDSLIAQSCIDAGVPLVTRDGDFRAFATGNKLVLATEHS
jgi:predicted nucleic acid-binding protein